MNSYKMIFLKGRSICFFLLLSIFVTSCGGETFKEKPQYKKAKSQTNVDSNSPEFNAARVLLKQGITSFNNQDFNKAEFSFEESIRIAPNYGQAYFWLAYAQSKLGKLKSSLHLLDKAEILLKTYKSWISKINELRQVIFQNKN